MTEQELRRAQEREEIAARIAKFKATQERFERERKEFFVSTWRRLRGLETILVLKARSNREADNKKPGDETPGFSTQR